MPDLYCQCCKQTTPHKSVMRRDTEDECTSFTRKFSELIGQLVTGKHYYKMVPQHYCRICNTHYQEIKQPAPPRIQPIPEASQVSMH